MDNPAKSSTPPLGDDRTEPPLADSSKFVALDAIAEPISVVDRHQRIVFLNKIMKGFFGDLRGKRCNETPLGVPSICAECPVKGNWDYDKGPYIKAAKDEDGRILEFSVTKYVDEATQEPFWVCIEHDLTEKLDYENRLKMLAASFDQMAEAVCVADLRGNPLYVNKAYIMLTGYDEKHGSSTLSIPDDRRLGPSGSTIQAIMHAASTEGWHGEMTGLRRDGTRYYTYVEAKPVRNDKGNPIGVVGILQDVTRIRSEKVEYEKYLKELEAKMESRTLELARKVSQLTTINKISRVVTSLLDLDELIAEFVKSIAQGFGYKHVAFMMMDRERGEVFFKSGYGWQMDSVPKDLRQKLKEGLIGNAAYYGETLVSGDVDQDPRYVRKDLIGTKSELCVPVTFRGEILGVLDVQSDLKDAFTKNDVTTVEMLGDMLATSIVNARVFTESKERETALSILDRISKQISYRLEPNVILEQVARDAATLLRAEKAAVALVDSTGKKLDFVAFYRFDKSKMSGMQFYSDRGVTGRALRSLKAEVVNDYIADPNASERDAQMFDIKSIVSAPLTIEGRGIGVVNVYNKIGEKPFTKGDALFLSSLADHAAIALENANLLTSLNQRVHSQLTLLETAVSMQRQIESSSIYDLVADKLREVVWYDELTFYRVDDERKMISPAVSRGPYAEQVMAEEFSTDVGITGWVVRTGKAQLVNDALSDPRGVNVEGTPEEKEALMAMPLISKDVVVGVLVVYRMGDNRFSDSEFEIAQLFANQASVALENSELYRAREDLLSESRMKVEQMSKVLELTTSVMYMDDLNRLLQRVADGAVESFGFKRAAVGVYDAERDVFLIRGHSGFPSWYKEKLERPADSILYDMQDTCRIGSSGYFMPFEKQEYGIDEFFYLAHPERATQPREAPDAWHERDILIFALKDRDGRLSGFLEVDEPIDMKIPSADKIELIEILVGIASIAIENANAYEKQVAAVNEIALLNDLMTHDINNFNQGIMGYIELLLEDKRLDENQRRYADRALLQVRNNARLIDNIRKLAKVRTMDVDDFEPMDIHDSIQEAIDAVTKASGERKMSIVSTVSPKTHYVMANQFLHEMFFNVISNAVKFDSSMRVRADVSVADETTAHGTFWVVSVTDRGRGIPDDRKGVVFERFATGMTGVKGFGLGLSIVKSIVDKLGGRVWVEDRIPGDFSRGSVFKIALPKAGPPVDRARELKG
ncbi:MAG: GAF domain-containing protein [Candidatus Thermoplasmatota archaeon]|nr:GAF domain-containing protein [Candidatus Thermoplasmatota archaeon]